ncbi:MAG: hypothetical protein E5X61_21410 [Mesorhizobium sp.]|nr:MAG: hypothetical protein EOR57_07500 [Mesorhizobium sp.]TIQ31711.1 MAG: hypothetical protein E5X61_21410 [Mesorhizobium sp.]
MSIGDIGGMQMREKPRWSLPYRLRNEGWWLVDPPQTHRSATIFPFIRKSPPPARIKAAEKIRS